MAVRNVISDPCTCIRNNTCHLDPKSHPPNRWNGSLPALPPDRNIRGINHCVYGLPPAQHSQSCNQAAEGAVARAPPTFAPSSTRSFTCSAPSASDDFCRVSFHHAAPSIIISAFGELRGCGPSRFERFFALSTLPASVTAASKHRWGSAVKQLRSPCGALPWLASRGWCRRRWTTLAWKCGCSTRVRLRASLYRHRQIGRGSVPSCDVPGVSLLLVALIEIPTPNLRDRLHHQHPLAGSRSAPRAIVNPNPRGVSFGR
jgi:hypothetical protein